MTTEELLKPRFKVIAGYPGSRFEIGDILYKYEYPKTSGLYCYVMDIVTPLNAPTANMKAIEDHPHLFKPLQWWEERRVEDMPEYVRIIKSPALTKERLNVGAVVKIYNHFSCSQGNYNKQGCQVFGDDFMSYSTCTPATKEEYEAQHRCQGENGGCVNSNICQANDKCMWPANPTNQLKDVLDQGSK